MTPLSGTRIGEMFEALDAKADANPDSEENIQQSMDEAQRLVFAAMGAEYLRAVIRAKIRTPEEALQHWLSFCTLANIPLLGSREKLEKLRPILRAVLKDVVDISSGKIQ